MSISTRLPRESPPADELTPNDPGERERLMADFSISYNGRHYEYDIYRYDRLADAVNYARLQRSKPSRDAEVRSLSMPSREYVEDPDESQRALMATLNITFQDGIYRLGAFRYDRLADAVNYARLQLRAPGPV
jgi:hypothetical protein